MHQTAVRLDLAETALQTSWKYIQFSFEHLDSVQICYGLSQSIYSGQWGPDHEISSSNNNNSESEYKAVRSPEEMYGTHSDF